MIYLKYKFEIDCKKFYYTIPQKTYIIHTFIVKKSEKGL